jgi:hypothetical protein
LHDLKMLRADHVQDRKRVKPSPLHDWQGSGARPARPSKPAKRRKSFGRRFFEEAVDLIEDIFD